MKRGLFLIIVFFSSTVSYAQSVLVTSDGRAYKGVIMGKKWGKSVSIKTGKQVTIVPWKMIRKINGKPYYDSDEWKMPVYIGLGVFGAGYLTTSISSIAKGHPVTSLLPVYGSFLEMMQKRSRPHRVLFAIGGLVQMSGLAISLYGYHTRARYLEEKKTHFFFGVSSNSAQITIGGSL